MEQGSKMVAIAIKGCTCVEHMTWHETRGDLSTAARLNHRVTLALQKG